MSALYIIIAMKYQFKKYILQSKIATELQDFLL